ncbi:MAG TPA: hypothetical protein GXX20_09910 [Clostridiaceae bacterium]|nr:hypothetical protein [Clostridiaceae bacterium]
MKGFKVPEKKINLEIKKRLINATPIILITMIAGFYIGLSRIGSSGNLYIVIPIAILISSFAIFIGIRRGYRINYESFTPFKIVLMDDYISRYQKNIPEIKITKSEVVSITEDIKNGITIKTKTPSKYIYIPNIIERYDELKESLSQWMEIKSVEKNKNQFLQIIAVPGIIIGFGLVMLSDSSYIVIPVGISLLLIFVWSTYYIQASPHVDTRIKKNIFVSLFPALIILYKILSFIF